MTDDYEDDTDVTNPGHDELADDDGIEVSFDDVHSDEDLDSVFTDGMYHVAFDGVEDHESERDGTKSYTYQCTLKVLNGDDPRMRGRTVKYWIGKGEKAVAQQRLLAIRMGLVGREVYGKAARINFKDLKGRQAIVKIRMGKGGGGFAPRPEVIFGCIWNVFHSEVAKVAKDEELIVTEDDYRAVCETNNAKYDRDGKPRSGKKAASTAAPPPAKLPAKPKPTGKPAPKQRKQVDWDS